MSKFEEELDSLGKHLKATYSIATSSTETPPSWLQNSLSDETADLLASKLRNGIFLSNFTAFEAFVKAGCDELLRKIDDANSSHDSMSESQISEAVHRLSDAIKSIPKWLSRNEREREVYQLSKILNEGFETRVFKLPSSVYFLGSNVTFTNLKDFATSVKRISPIKPPLKGLQLGDVTSATLRLITPYRLAPTTKRDQFERCMDELGAIRNKVAHDADFSLQISDLLTQTRLLEAVAKAWHVWISFEIWRLQLDMENSIFSTTIEFEGNNLRLSLDYSRGSSERMSIEHVA
ncbi:hypothetical protein [Corynebacterium guangdongense]|uniref:RiboL-PSP-HEPN domain-containing protein n=1 Tax=Corynebacterium guangdongense TaxID=1783348 RepID=A0ABU1ZYC7_9CORY|nr:hypothetical protein [Corynebacterium guangdongense]MDR7329939.1 hypothetical protein [Corynebacterium guangdongense]WJZ18497.1 hypothetical protein CGUA_09710 [Corynebacterium guangdongense]